MELTKTYSDIAQYGEKYHFYHTADNRTVVCTTLYKGQIVRGVAKCNIEDHFDIEFGKQLAYLRCKQKFMNKKLKRAKKSKDEAIIVAAKANNNLWKANEFVNDVEMQLADISKELNEFELKLDTTY